MQQQAKGSAEAAPAAPSQPRRGRSSLTRKESAKKQAAPSSEAEPAGNTRMPPPLVRRASSLGVAPMHMKRAKLEELLRERWLEHRQRCEKYYRSTIPQIQSELASDQKGSDLDAAKQLLAGNADVAGLTEPNAPTVAMLHALAGPPPVYRQALPEKDLAPMIDAVLTQIMQARPEQQQ